MSGQQKYVGSILVFFVVTAIADESLSAKCSGLYNSQGFLTQAQSVCGLKLNNESLLKNEKQCLAVLGEEEMRLQVMEGKDLFVKNQKQSGRAAACNMAIKLFPNELTR